MSRKSGKPPQQPLSEHDRKELLNELDSVQDMLRNPAADAGKPPVLQPEDTAVAPSDDANQQMPLLRPEDANDPARDEASERLRQALRERPNPFLSGAARRTSPRSEAPASAPPLRGADQPAPDPPSAGSLDTAKAEPNLSEQQVRALVDEVLSAWLPKIERELRTRLMEHLRDQQD